MDWRLVKNSKIKNGFGQDLHDLQDGNSRTRTRARTRERNLVKPDTFTGTFTFTGQANRILLILSKTVFDLVKGHKMFRFTDH